MLPLVVFRNSRWCFQRQAAGKIKRTLLCCNAGMKGIVCRRTSASEYVEAAKLPDAEYQ